MSPGPFSIREQTSRDGYHRGREIVSLQGVALARLPYGRDQDAELLVASWNLLRNLRALLEHVCACSDAAKEAGQCPRDQATKLAARLKEAP